MKTSIARLFVTICGLCTALFALTSCNTKDAAAIQGNWTITAFNNEAISADDTPFIHFETSKGEFNGCSGCNLFFGSFAVNKDGSLEVTMGGSTRKFCPDVTWEDDMFQALAQVTNYVLEDENSRLLLQDQAGNTLLTLQRAE